MSPRLPKVIRRSASRRASLAFATVVSIRSYWNNAVTRFRSKARRCDAVRLSFRWSLRCRMERWSSPPRGPEGLSVLGVEPDRGLALVVRRNVHPEGEAHFAENVLDLFQRLPAEVPVLEHLALALLHQVTDVLDLGGPQAVARADGELQLLDALLQQTADAQDVFVDLLFHFLLDRLLEVDEEVEVVTKDLGGDRHGVGRQDARVRPHVDGQLVVVDALAETRGLDVVVHLQHRREQGVDRNHADRTLGLRVLVGGDVAAATVDLDFHAQIAVLVERRDVEVGIQHRHLAVHLQIPGANLALATHLERALLGPVTQELQSHLLEVEDDLRDVLDDTGERRELVQHPIDSNGRDGGSLQGRKQDPAQGVTEGQAEPALERLDRELAVAIGIAPIGHDLLRHREVLPL